MVIPLAAAQRLAGLPGRVSLIQISVAATPPAMNDYIAALTRRLPGADVHGIRQFTEAEAKIYDRISGLLNATVVVVLILTTLCVMAAMTNVAMERKNDVGLMKAIGGATRRVLRLFLAEAAVLGLLGGIVGAAAGIVLSIGLGKAVFGVAAKPRLIVYPVAVTLTVLVAIASAYPLRRLASIRPASVFRGE
jgi:putative ABC transport system permease protein